MKLDFYILAMAQFYRTNYKYFVQNLEKINFKFERTHKYYHIYLFIEF